MEAKTYLIGDETNRWWDFVLFKILWIQPVKILISEKNEIGKGNPYQFLYKLILIKTIFAS